MSEINEIECAMFNAADAWLDAKTNLNTFDLDPAKAMIDIGEAIKKLLLAQRHLVLACELQEKDNRSAAA